MKTAQDSYTPLENVRFQEKMHPEKIAFIKFKIAAYWPVFTFACLLFGKPC